MKHLAKAALCALYKYSGIMRAQEALRRRRYLSIVLFHRITDEIPPDALTVGTRWFERFCRTMRRSFNVVPLAEIVRLAHSSEPFPPRTLAITFDDCYRDNLFAARVLARYQLPACFFIPTASVGTDHMFAWDRGLKKLANLSWDDVRQMAGLGHEIGSHTVTHADLGQVSPDEARTELADSKNTLEAKLERPVRWLAYPFGGKQNFRPEYSALA